MKARQSIRSAFLVITVPLLLLMLSSSEALARGAPGMDLEGGTNAFSPAQASSTPPVHIVSDSTWRVSPLPAPGWETINFDDSAWGYSVAPAPVACGWITCPYDPSVLTMWDQAQSYDVYFRKTFTLTTEPIVSALLTSCSDDDHDVYVNGTLVASDWDGYAGPPITTDISRYLVPGKNVIAIKAQDTMGVCRWMCINATILYQPPGPTSTISGHVADAHNKILQGVIISDGQGHTAVTDPNGNYALSGLTAGTYVLTASKQGYIFSPSPSLPITVPPDTTQNFTTCNLTVSWELSKAPNLLIPSVTPACSQDVTLAAANPNPYWINFGVTRVGDGLTYSPASSQDVLFDALKILPPCPQTGGCSAIHYNAHYAAKKQRISIRFSSLPLDGRYTAQDMNVVSALEELALSADSEPGCQLDSLQTSQATSMIAFFKTAPHLASARDAIFSSSPNRSQAADEVARAWPNEFTALGDTLASSGLGCFKQMVTHISNDPAKSSRLVSAIPVWLNADIYLLFSSPSGFADYYSH